MDVYIKGKLLKICGSDSFLNDVPFFSKIPRRRSVKGSLSCSWSFLSSSLDRCNFLPLFVLYVPERASPPVNCTVERREEERERGS